jgi:hypothetical protein
MITSCTFDHSTPAAAHIRQGAGLPYSLCFRHLNAWLDAADDGLASEPLSLTFIDPCPADVATWWSVDPAAVLRSSRIGSRTSFGPSRRRYYLNRRP